MNMGIWRVRSKEQTGGRIVSMALGKAAATRTVAAWTGEDARPHMSCWFAAPAGLGKCRAIG
jgi:hypothetical protein